MFNTRKRGPPGQDRRGPPPQKPADAPNPFAGIVKFCTCLFGRLRGCSIAQSVEELLHELEEHKIQMLTIVGVVPNVRGDETGEQECDEYKNRSQILSVGVKEHWGRSSLLTDEENARQY